MKPFHLMTATALSLSLAGATTANELRNEALELFAPRLPRSLH